MFRGDHPRPRRVTIVRDLLLAVAVCAVAQLELLLTPGASTLPLHLTTLVIVPALALRRIAPLAGVFVAAASLAIDPLVGSAAVAVPYLALLFLLASLGWFATVRDGLVGIAAILVAGIGIDLFDGTRPPFGDVVVNAVLVVLPWAGAVLLRASTERRVRIELEAADRERAAIEHERGRIARDLHDSLAHALTLIALQASAARERTEERVAAVSLETIEQASREALDDMHRVLGLIGTSGEDAPGVANLADLVDRVTRTGTLDVELDLDVAAELPTSISTTAYRVVQEALTNVTRHSSATSARVHVRRERDVLVATVSDPGPACAAARTGGSGRGLAGLRERLALFGGSLHAAAHGSGWAVEARIPLTRVRGVAP